MPPKRNLTSLTEDDSIIIESGTEKVSRIIPEQVNRPSKEIQSCASGCGQSVLLKPPAGIPCFLCNKFTHFKCTGLPNTNKDKVKKFSECITSKKFKLFYLCKTCAPLKESLRPTGIPTDGELKAKLKEHNKEIDKLTTCIAETESNTNELKKKIANRKEDQGPFSVANLTHFDEVIKQAIAPLLAEIRELRNEIAALKTNAQPVAVPKVKLREPAKIVENSKTLAEILAETDSSMEAVRNIKIEGTDEEIPRERNLI